MPCAPRLLWPDPAQPSLPPACRIGPVLRHPEPSEMPDIRKHQPPSRPHSIEAGTKPGAVQQWAVWAEEVERLLEQGKSKPAVELAKVAHKHTASEASEDLWVTEYDARIIAQVQA